MANKTAAEKLQVTVATYRWGFVIAGIVAIVLGIMVLAWPGEMVEIAAWLIALYSLASGVIYILTGIRSKDGKKSGRISRVLAGVAFLIVGVIMLSFLGASAAVLTNVLGIILGVLWVGEGIATLLVMRSLGGTSTGVLVYSIIAIAIGVVLLFTPLWGAQMLRWIVGFGLAGLGVAQVARAMMVSSEVSVEITD